MGKCLEVFQEEGIAVPMTFKCACACFAKRTRHGEPGVEFKGESSERTNHVEFWLLLRKKPLKNFE